MNFSYLTALALASVVVGQVTYHSGLNIDKCMDLTGNVQANGTSVIIFDCNGQVNQQWVPDFNAPAIHLYANQGFCLDGGINPRVGSPLVIAPCNPNFSSQRFTPTLSTNLIELSTTGLCITVPNDDTTNTNPLRLGDCVSSGAIDPGQLWHAAQLRKFDE